LVNPVQSRREKYHDIPMGYKTNKLVITRHGKTNI
jgi:hypothetical protein